MTQPGIFELVDTAVPGIDSCTISGSRIRSGYIPGAVQNRIRDGRPERSNVQVSDSVQPHAAPPQIRDTKINVRGDLPLEGDIRLMGVRVPQVLIRKSDIHRSRRRVERRRRQIIRIDRSCSQLLRCATVVGDVFSIRTVIGEEPVDQPGLVPCEKHAVSGASNRFRVQPIRNPRARSDVVGCRVDNTGLRVVRIHDAGLWD